MRKEKHELTLTFDTSDELYKFCDRYRYKFKIGSIVDYTYDTWEIQGENNINITP